MFTLTITEKGGAQRRMEFDKPEVTIGRVQGNDIILPKGNVSKRHSRIVLKDGRFIVVDLKSTNGTYVNGRKITSPLVVKAGDKIYIGDFIITLEEVSGGFATAGAGAPMGPMGAMDDEPSSPGGPSAMPPPAMAAAGPPALGPGGPERRPPPMRSQPPPPMGPPPMAAVPSAGPPPLRAPTVDFGAPPPLPSARAPRPAAPSEPPPPPRDRFALDEDPSDESLPPRPRVAGAPGLGGPGSSAPTPVPPAMAAAAPPAYGAPPAAAPPPYAPPAQAAPVSQPAIQAAPPGPAPAAPLAPAMPGSPPAYPPVAASPGPSPYTPQAAPAAPPHAAAPQAPPSQAAAPAPAYPTPQAAPPAAAPGPSPSPAYGVASAPRPAGPPRSVGVGPLHALVTRVGQQLDLRVTDPRALADEGRWRAAQAAIDAALAALGNEGALGGEDRDALGSAALREVAGLGAIDALLGDPSVRAIVVESPARVLVDRGEGLAPTPLAYSSPAALAIAAQRIAAQSAVALDAAHTVTEVRLGESFVAHLAIAPVAPAGAVIALTRLDRRGRTGAQLVEQGLLAPEQLDHLRAAVAARRNVVVSGPLGAPVTELLGALVALVPHHERVVAVEDIEGLALDHPQALALTAGGKRALRDVLRTAEMLHPDRLVVDDLRGGDVYDVLVAMSARRGGVLAGVHASSTGDALRHLEVLASLDGRCAPDRARGLVAEAVQTVVQLGPDPGGRVRVLAIDDLQR
jgi:pilus assembly protein CpaF